MNTKQDVANALAACQSKIQEALDELLAKLPAREVRLILARAEPAPYPLADVYVSVEVDLGRPR